ncbi:hypothetical protein [Tepidibacter hydrothermalis]|uniref:DUF4352 domain-containing protein n=1 Tax=Tepidibacter hydrothermalis TaxID=3036126 RepID=A0ABY8EA39_9FIRM|nr:hypothetical protein [Tepidibacter hydrothermalis]WFD09801.1 hypothetical protein P4S50_15590 [Tepidibacter hydrothermalis]
MNDKTKAGILIFLMSITFYMMLTTPYTHALGDYILEFVGLKAWTGDYSGNHLTIIYFGILFMIFLHLVGKYVIDGLGIRIRSVFLIFVVLVTVFYSITGITAKNIKKNSSGLLAIGYNPAHSSMNYRYEDNKFVEFIAEFELTNYSDEKKTFYLSIDSPFYREDGIDPISFYTFDGDRAVFELEGNETKLFLLSLDNYNVIWNRNFGSGGGTVQQLVLTSDKGNKVRLDNKNFFGFELSR